MSNILEQAKLFFEACETGKGWDGCKAYCHTDATFSAQSGALSEIDTLEGYSEWMKNLFTPVPDSLCVKFAAYLITFQIVLFRNHLLKKLLLKQCTVDLMITSTLLVSIENY